MAPELFARKAKPTPASDVYSLGMVLWELASRKLPFADAANQVIVMGWIKDGEVEEFSGDAPPALKQMVLDAWVKEPAQRPTAQAMLQRIDHELQLAASAAQVSVSVTPPNVYCCPITGELMDDPVVAADGNTYERSAIEQWFERGRITTNLVIAPTLTCNMAQPN